MGELKEKSAFLKISTYIFEAGNFLKILGIWGGGRGRGIFQSFEIFEAHVFIKIFLIKKNVYQRLINLLFKEQMIVVKILSRGGIP